MTTNTPISEQLKQLCELFPEADEEVCQAVFQSHNGNLEASINAMLSITDPNYIPEEIPLQADNPAPQPEQQLPAEDLTSVITSTSEQQLRADEDLARALMAEEERQAAQAQAQAQPPTRPPLPTRNSGSNDLDPTLQEIKDKFNVFTDTTVKKIKEMYNRLITPEDDDLYGQQMPHQGQNGQNTGYNQTSGPGQNPARTYNESSRYNNSDFLDDPDDMRSASIINTPFQNSAPPRMPPRTTPDNTGFVSVSTEGIVPSEPKESIHSYPTKNTNITAEPIPTTNFSTSSDPVSLYSAAEPVPSFSAPETSAVVAPTIPILAKEDEETAIPSHTTASEPVTSFSAPEASTIAAPTMPTLADEDNSTSAPISFPTTTETVTSFGSPEASTIVPPTIPTIAKEDDSTSAPISFSGATNPESDASILENPALSTSTAPTLSQESSNAFDISSKAAPAVSESAIFDQASSKDSLDTTNPWLPGSATSADQISSIADNFSKTKVTTPENSFDDETKH
ncbi:hypothetical protein K7432_010450 [Basidiobolus ranarum]|uniref:CUE domain-containing protein n=1 Tax=Basidiobolus ranarum TaxID=34480 RepID=A0ABR2WNP8_9FUNG